MVKRITKAQKEKRKNIIYRLYEKMAKNDKSKC